MVVLSPEASSLLMMNATMNNTMKEPDDYDPTDCSNWTPENSRYVQNPYKTTSAFMLGGSMAIMNILVILLMGWSMWKSITVPKLLVLMLAVFDGSYAVFSILPQSFRYWWGYCGSGGLAVCVGCGFTSNVVIIMSSWFIVLMAAERYVALRMPFRYAQIFTLVNTWKILGAMMVYALLVASLPFLGINSYSWGPQGCDFDWRDRSTGGLFYSYFRGFTGLVIMPIIIFLNIAVLREINKMTKMVAAVAPADTEKGGSGVDAASKSLQQRFAVLTLLASTAFVVCNTPILVGGIRLIQYQQGIMDALVPTYVIKRMVIANGLVNPCLSLFFYLSNMKLSDVLPCIKKPEKK